ncbi:Heat shock protein ssb1 [Rhodotorula toruloides]
MPRLNEELPALRARHIMRTQCRWMRWMRHYGAAWASPPSSKQTSGPTLSLGGNLIAQSATLPSCCLTRVRAFTTRANISLESYVASVEATLQSPEASKIKRHNRSALEAELSKALERLEIEDSSADELRRANLHLKRGMQKALAGGR